jgi:CRP/FNR family cyclic AMP-dependent transcriptional regulator
MTQGDTKLQGLFKPNFAGLFRNEENVVTLKPGDVLFRKGDAGDCMFDPAARAATVTAQTDCTLAKIDEKRFLFLTQQTPSFALNVMRVLSQRLRRMDAMVTS